MTSAYYGYNVNNGLGQYFSPQQQMSNLINQHPQYFNQAMQQAVQPQQFQQIPQQQNITTQPPIMQPTNDSRNNAKILYVGNREEAFVHPVDLVYSTPTFFFNRGTNEVYMKQYDGTTGNALFKVYIEQVKPIEKPAETSTATVAIPNDNAYMNELKMIRAGIEGLYRYFNQPQPVQTQQTYYYQNPQRGEEIIDVDYTSSEEQGEIKEQPKTQKGSKKS